MVFPHVAGYFREIFGSSSAVASSPSARASARPEAARNLGNLVREKRRRSPIRTQAELAAVAHSTDSVVSDLMNGARPIPWETVERIVRALDADSVWIAEVREMWQTADLAWRSADVHVATGERVGPGQLLDEVDPIDDLEVHLPITVDQGRGLPPLPPYFSRGHDTRLAVLVERAVAGKSTMAVLVGESSTGKTRALWESLTPLRTAGEWRLWHPQYPTRRQALVDELNRVGPQTVLWLNETQKYLGDGTGAGDEQVAAALRNLLADSSRTPVLILGTLWRRHYDALCRDPASQSRKLLEDRVIEVPSTFTDAELASMRQTRMGDPRLVMALDRAEDGQVTQYLAGGPELVDRYRLQVSPAAKAIIEVAMDASRMGYGDMLPHALLESGALAYMTSLDRDRLAENWFESALAQTSEPCKGARGPVTRIHSLSAHPRSTRRSVSPVRDGFSAGEGPLYRLADYLDQYGRMHRADLIPPIGFWEAVARHGHPDSLTGLGAAAHARGLYCDAAQLWKNAALLNHDPGRIGQLVALLHKVHPDDDRPSMWAVENVALGSSAGVAYLLDLWRTAEMTTATTALASRIASHIGDIELGSVSGAADLWKALTEAGAVNAAAALLTRIAARIDALAFSDISGPTALGRQLEVPDATYLLAALKEAGMDTAATQLRFRIASSVNDFDFRHGPTSVRDLLHLLREEGMDPAATTLVDRVTRYAEGVALDSPLHVGAVLDSLCDAGLDTAAAALATRIASRIDDLDCNDLWGIALLYARLKKAGMDTVLTALVAWVASHIYDIALDNPLGLFSVQKALRQMGMDTAANCLSTRLIRHIEDDVPKDLVGAVIVLDAFGAAEADVRAGLIHRMPAAGEFKSFVKYSGQRERFRFGRDPNGQPAAAWTWDDLFN
ncbi:helix-turn-helix domain-containing protein [Nocardia sp. NPDC051570]|uniref:helix-turn-helix domain-containing protein n=1 Tax=Nocardia sp. NPDC051570 TaxID=3364324 RepID=UPI0037B4BA89